LPSSSSLSSPSSLSWLSSPVAPSPSSSPVARRAVAIDLVVFIVRRHCTATMVHQCVACMFYLASPTIKVPRIGGLQEQVHEE
jgi:hypothetical protein